MRQEISDDVWAVIEPLLPRVSGWGRPWLPHRQVVEGIVSDRRVNSTDPDRVVLDDVLVLTWKPGRGPSRRWFNSDCTTYPRSLAATYRRTSSVFVRVFGETLCARKQTSCLY